MKTYGYLQGDEYYIYGTEDIICKMFNSLNTEKQNEALSYLGIDNKDSINTEDRFSELVLPVFEFALSGNSNNKTEGISLKILEKLAEKTDIEPLAVYTQKEILKIIINEIERKRLNIPLIEFITNLRYQKIIAFLKYLNTNSTDIIPRGYYDFMIQYNTLLE